MAYGEVFASITICSGLVMKQITWAISKWEVENFEQSAMDVYLDFTKAQHNWISWVVAMYLLQSLFIFTKKKKKIGLYQLKPDETLRQGQLNKFGFLIR